MDADIRIRLQEAMQVLRARRETMLGYPLNQSDRLPVGALTPFLGMVLNNLGDPFSGGSCGMNTFEFEREVIQWFADLWNLPKQDAWGYVVNSGTEGNFQGMLLGREVLGDPVLYASEATHYSIWKAAKILKIPVVKVQCDELGGIDLDDLSRTMNVFCHQRPSLFCLNAGTVMSGAVDNIPGAIEVAKQSGGEFYIHVDAALSGLLLPFFDGAPEFDFRLPVNSISVSGHKMPGCPIPCGAFVTRKRQAESIEYIGSRDSTISGSRDGWSVLALWLAIQHYGRNGFYDMARQCQHVAEQARELLGDIGWDSWMAPPYSISVMIKRPSEAICRKWQLAVEGDQAHIVCMPHVTIDMVKNFVNDLVTSKKKEGEVCVI